MKPDPTTEYRGVTLHFVKDSIGDRRQDLWEAWGDQDIRGSLSECMAQIDRIELEKRVSGGMKLWSLEHDNPKYWGQYDALFRDGGSILFRNGTDPDRTYSRPRSDCALVTPEVQSAIEVARAAYAALVAANDEWKRLRRAIPRLSAEDALALPERMKP